MGQQLLDSTGRLRGQPLEDVSQVRVGLVPVQACRVHQAHNGCGPLAGAQATGEQPVRPAESDGSDLVFHPVVTRHACSAPSITPGGAEPSAEYPPLTGIGGDGSMSCGQAGVRQ